ncbi:MAG: glycosyltransferase family 2 protein [Treponema sp.]|nr:glycosyltransferase family 2 protein [Treponema sp.]
MEKVSVIIPVYNAGKTIRQTVDSIKAQTYENWEIVIVNDGSTDDSLEICRSLEDEKIRVFDKPNGGVVSAYKMGIQKANGTLVSFCDADDLYKPEYLENAVKIIGKHGCDFVSFGCTLSEENDSRLEVNATREGFYGKSRIESEILTHCLFNGFIPGKYYMILVYRWNKVYKRELIDRFVDQLDEKCFQV